MAEKPFACAFVTADRGEKTSAKFREICERNTQIFEA